MSTDEREKERKIIKELIELYRDMPCLWDVSCEAYKDVVKRKSAWEILLPKFKELEPDANSDSIKKKMDNLKYSYQREAKKVKKSKKPGSKYVHRPCLWYYDLMTFLNKNQEATGDEEDTMDNDENPIQPVPAPPPKKSKSEDLEKKKATMLVTEQKLLRNLLEQSQTTTKTFCTYVGEKLDGIRGEQRELAERLISEVLFQAKMNCLSLDTKIITSKNVDPLLCGHLTQHSPIVHSFQPAPTALVQQSSFRSSTRTPEHSLLISGENDSEVKLEITDSEHGSDSEMEVYFKDK